MIGILWAVEDTVTSPAWWQQAASIVVTIAGVVGALATAAFAVWRFVPGVRSWLARRQEERRLERVAAWVAIAEVALPEILRRELEPPLAEVRSQVAATRHELVAHTAQERQLVRAVMETAVHVNAMRQADVDAIRRAMDLEEESFDQVRGEIPPR